MKIMKLAVQNFVSDESGQDLIEYALIASLLSLVAVSTLGALATTISGFVYIDRHGNQQQNHLAEAPGGGRTADDRHEYHRLVLQSKRFQSTL